jgi:hypothetical protein
MLTEAQRSLDACRAALCALSWVSGGRAEPVHVLRIRHLSRAIFPQATTADDLCQLEDFGEACGLSGGYWVPVRPSVIPLADIALLVAPTPDSEFRRLLRTCSHAHGLMRVCPIENAPTWPRQSVDHWMKRPQSLRDWTMRQVAAHSADLQPTRANSDQIEFYCPSPKQMGYRRRWIPLRDRKPDSASDSLHLLRERVSGRTVRRFVGQCSGNEVSHEAILKCDLIRLQFGLEVLAGDTQSLRAQRTGDVLAIALTRPLPREEKKLILALCDVTDNERSTDVRIPHYAEYECRRALGELGFHFGENLG